MLVAVEWWGWALRVWSNRVKQSSPPLACLFFSSPPPTLTLHESHKIEKLLQTVELESWTWWMSSKCDWIPWGVAEEKDWPSRWHLMEFRAFYLRDVNLCPDQSWVETLQCLLGGLAEPDLKPLSPAPSSLSWTTCRLSRQQKAEKAAGETVSWCFQPRQKLPCSLWMGRNTPLICVQVIPR